MRKLSYWLIAFVICCSVMDMPAYAVAESTEISLSASKDAIGKGTETEVLVTAKPQENAYGIEFILEYDASALMLRESTGVDYSLFESEAANPASGSLHVSAIAKQSAGGTIAKLRFRALKAGVRTEIKLTAVKGVSRERTTREQNGQVYPDLKEIKVHAGSPLTIRLLPSSESSVPADQTTYPSPSDIRKEPDALKAVALLTDRLRQSDIQSDIEGWSALVRDISIRLLTVHPVRTEVGSVMQVVLNDASLMPVLEAYHLLQQTAKAAGAVLSYPYALTVEADERDRTELRIASLIHDRAASLGLAIEMKNRHFVIMLEPDRLRFNSSGYASVSVVPVIRPVEHHGITRVEPVGSYRFQFGQLEDASSVKVRWLIPARMNEVLAGVYRWDAESGDWAYRRESERDHAGRTITTFLENGEYGFLLYEKEFADLGSTYDEAAQAIRALGARGVVSGKGGDSYGVEQLVTRAEWTAMLVRALGLDAHEKAGQRSDTAFKDVENGRWYAPFIAAASSQGWITGYEDGTYRPDERISRAELAVMLDRMWPGHGVESHSAIQSYTDDEHIPQWAVSAVYRMRASGFMKGDEYYRFHPNDEVGRDDAAVVLMRMIVAWSTSTHVVK
ncbi:S-layer homology domain-containing protein [Paenibacillus sp. 1011MAR3C5]|uniref:S-layer homology domain-containing protein n=1 Tax=Paenibacillus sp. 1011MAR3C5 TaxID=1675787 RepID=UPI0016038F5D|nr:S-layer homology domain-containing protein [Paenibacillus sp. 1011MAR3C5]